MWQKVAVKSCVCNGRKLHKSCVMNLHQTTHKLLSDREKALFECLWIWSYRRLWNIFSTVCCGNVLYTYRMVWLLISNRRVIITLARFWRTAGHRPSVNDTVHPTAIGGVFVRTQQIVRCCARRDFRRITRRNWIAANSARARRPRIID